jgi:hypothetical protein
MRDWAKKCTIWRALGLVGPSLHRGASVEMQEPPRDGMMAV